MSGKEVIGGIKDLFFPPKCVSCLTPLPCRDTALCPECERIFGAERMLRCSACGRPHVRCTCRVHYNGEAFPIIHLAGYEIKRASVVKNIVLRLKDEPLSAGFDTVASLLYELLLERFREFSDKEPRDFVYTWIPRSAKARRKAGHDQSEEVAKRVAFLAGGLCADIFASAGKAAQKTLDKEKRQRNAENIYSFVSSVNLHGKTVVIIDDIVTSGASMGVCGALAKREGAKSVIALVCAKTESDREKNKDSVDLAIG